MMKVQRPEQAVEGGEDEGEAGGGSNGVTPSKLGTGTEAGAALSFPGKGLSLPTLDHQGQLPQEEESQQQPLQPQVVLSFDQDLIESSQSPDHRHRMSKGGKRSGGAVKTGDLATKLSALEHEWMVDVDHMSSVRSSIGSVDSQLSWDASSCPHPQQQRHHHHQYRRSRSKSTSPVRSRLRSRSPLGSASLHEEELTHDHDDHHRAVAYTPERLYRGGRRTVPSTSRSLGSVRSAESSPSRQTVYSSQTVFQRLYDSPFHTRKVQNREESWSPLKDNLSPAGKLDRRLKYPSPHEVQRLKRRKERQRRRSAPLPSSASATSSSSHDSVFERLYRNEPRAEQLWHLRGNPVIIERHGSHTRYYSYSPRRPIHNDDHDNKNGTPSTPSPSRMNGNTHVISPNGSSSEKGAMEPHNNTSRGLPSLMEDETLADLDDDLDQVLTDILGPSTAESSPLVHRHPSPPRGDDDGWNDIDYHVFQEDEDEDQQELANKDPVMVDEKISDPKPMAGDITAATTTSGSSSQPGTDNDSAVVVGSATIEAKSVDKELDDILADDYEDQLAVYATQDDPPAGYEAFADTMPIDTATTEDSETLADSTTLPPMEMTTKERRHHNPRDHNPAAEMFLDEPMDFMEQVDAATISPGMDHFRRRVAKSLECVVEMSERSGSERSLWLGAESDHKSGHEEEEEKSRNKSKSGYNEYGSRRARKRSEVNHRTTQETTGPHCSKLMKDEKGFAAAKIQSIWRMHTQRARYAQDMDMNRLMDALLRKDRSGQIRSQWSQPDQAAMASIRTKRNNAAIVIQRYWYAHLARSVFLRFPAFKETTAISESSLHGKVTRSKYRSLWSEVISAEQAATRIQSSWRRYACRKEFLKSLIAVVFYRASLGTSKKSQHAHQGTLEELERKAYRVLKKRGNWRKYKKLYFFVRKSLAACTIQAWFRRHQSKSWRKQLRESIQDNTSVETRKFWRAHIIRVRYALLRVQNWSEKERGEQHSAALVIQHYWYGHLFRRTVAERQAETVTAGQKLDRLTYYHLRRDLDYAHSPSSSSCKELTSEKDFTEDDNEVEHAELQRNGTLKVQSTKRQRQVAFQQPAGEQQIARRQRGGGTCIFRCYRVFRKKKKQNRRSGH